MPGSRPPLRAVSTFENDYRAQKIDFWQPPPEFWRWVERLAHTKRTPRSTDGQTGHCCCKGVTRAGRWRTEHLLNANFWARLNWWWWDGRDCAVEPRQARIQGAWMFESPNSRLESNEEEDGEWAGPEDATGALSDLNQKSICADFVNWWRRMPPNCSQTGATAPRTGLRKTSRPQGAFCGWVRL